ncbi:MULTISPECIES: helix-turn-helix transcriptional regulator [unclassified Streptomyces]|uniref:helix-turn-helix transcriptional regulator n=2 Tax=Streptomyces TaxID=1883 RepID=UPI002252CFDA|nr:MULTISPECIES: helix-turn-helix transcriptional regulator [unclassified Streptomyces]MCX4551244.1 helix-turn-helix transcriptional regulator [Streptomyces sp. NBC_01500]WSC22639.1 helix-turn-helix transcriptional regulator [Streptomyces sp. NBC_01766]
MTTVAPESDVRRHELAAFLRSRRERITPEQAGLPRGSRRRTPGLRREEVAQLASVGVTWYTWLEQARDIKVSPQVLDAIARTLLLDRSERTHLFSLSGAVDPTPAGSTCPTVSPALVAMIEQLDPLPACIQNSRYDILAYNRTYGQLFCDLDAVAPEDRNCMLLSYTNEDWRSSLVELHTVHRLMAAKFRASMAEHLAEPAWKVLLKRLEAASPEFRELWARHEVVGPSARTKHFHNRHVGSLRVNHTDLWLGPSSGPRMVTYIPVDAESRDRLERLYRLAPATV